MQIFIIVTRAEEAGEDRGEGQQRDRRQTMKKKKVARGRQLTLSVLVCGPTVSKKERDEKKVFLGVSRACGSEILVMSQESKVANMVIIATGQTARGERKRRERTERKRGATNQRAAACVVRREKRK